MKNKIALVAVSLVLASAAYAQGGGVTTSTDPAKAAQVEQHAQALKAQQPATGKSKHATRHGKAAHTSHTSHKATAKHP